jgi:DNA-binding transcriptional ArsR family regulator
MTDTQDHEKLAVGQDDPEAAGKVIEALSEKTRLAMLGLLVEHPDGLTASDLSTQVDKKIPTILYHLDILSQAGLVSIELKRKDPGSGRPVKHWRVAKKAIQLDIDIQSLVLFTVPLSSCIEELQTYYRANKLEFKMGIPVNPHDILKSSKRALTLAQAELLATKITTDRLLGYCLVFMTKEFESGRANRVNVLGIAKRCAVEEELAQQVFYQLIATGRFLVEDDRLILK